MGEPTASPAPPGASDSNVRAFLTAIKNIVVLVDMMSQPQTGRLTRLAYKGGIASMATLVSATGTSAFDSIARRHTGAAR